MTVGELLKLLLDNCSWEDPVCIVCDQQEPFADLDDWQDIAFVHCNGKAVLLRNI